MHCQIGGMEQGYRAAIQDGAHQAEKYIGSTVPDFAYFHQTTSEPLYGDRFSLLYLRTILLGSRGF